MDSRESLLAAAGLLQSNGLDEQFFDGAMEATEVSGGSGALAQLAALFAEPQRRLAFGQNESPRRPGIQQACEGCSSFLPTIRVFTAEDMMPSVEKLVVPVAKSSAEIGTGDPLILFQPAKERKAVGELNIVSKAKKARKA